VRQLGHPALLAAQYSGNTSAVASAAVNELEEALVNCLEELTRPAPDHGAAGRADWVHLFFSVLPLLPLHHAKEEARVAGALRSAVAALVAKHNTAFRRAGVAVWEIRFRVPDTSGAWRVLVSCPTGARSRGRLRACCLPPLHRHALFCPCLPHAAAFLTHPP
jgi:hypothetical protein